MRLVTVPGLVLGLVLTAPALLEAWSDPAVDLTGVLLRFVLAAVVASAALTGLGTLVAGYARATRARASYERRGAARPESG